MKLFHKKSDAILSVLEKIIAGLLYLFSATSLVLAFAYVYFIYRSKLDEFFYNTQEINVLFVTTLVFVSSLLFLLAQKTLGYSKNWATKIGFLFFYLSMAALAIVVFMFMAVLSALGN